MPVYTKVPATLHEEIGWLAGRISDQTIEFKKLRSDCDHYKHNTGGCGFGLPCVKTCNPILCPLRD